MKRIGPGQQIVIRIDPETGETKMEAMGFGGMGCKDATKPFEDALGVAKDREMKPIAFRAVAATDEIRLEARA